MDACALVRAPARHGRFLNLFSSVPVLIFHVFNMDRRKNNKQGKPPSVGGLIRNVVKFFKQEGDRNRLKISINKPMLRTEKALGVSID